MYAVTRQYRFNPRDAAELDRMVAEEFVPLIRKTPGFVSYVWIDTGHGSGASVGVYRDKAGAEESVRVAAEYVRTRMSAILHEKPVVLVGAVKAHATG